MAAVSAPAASRVLDRLPPASFFVVSAVFHYFGPALAVLLFVHVRALGVAWLRVAAAAVVFALWRRPWRGLRPGPPRGPAAGRGRRGAPGPPKSPFSLPPLQRPPAAGC